MGGFLLVTSTLLLPSRIRLNEFKLAVDDDDNDNGDGSRASSQTSWVARKQSGKHDDGKLCLLTVVC